jgi:hypothetical protein
MARAGGLTPRRQRGPWSSSCHRPAQSESASTGSSRAPFPHPPAPAARGRVRASPHTIAPGDCRTTRRDSDAPAIRPPSLRHVPRQCFRRLPRPRRDPGLVSRWWATSRRPTTLLWSCPGWGARSRPPTRSLARSRTAPQDTLPKAWRATWVPVAGCAAGPRSVARCASATTSSYCQRPARPLLPTRRVLLFAVCSDTRCALARPRTSPGPWDGPHGRGPSPAGAAAAHAAVRRRAFGPPSGLGGASRCSRGAPGSPRAGYRREDADAPPRVAHTATPCPPAARPRARIRRAQTRASGSPPFFARPQSPPAGPTALHRRGRVRLAATAAPAELSVARPVQLTTCDTPRPAALHILGARRRPGPPRTSLIAHRTPRPPAPPARPPPPPRPPPPGPHRGNGPCATAPLARVTRNRPPGGRPSRRCAAPPSATGSIRDAPALTSSAGPDNRPCTRPVHRSPVDIERQSRTAACCCPSRSSITALETRVGRAPRSRNERPDPHATPRGAIRAASLPASTRRGRPHGPSAGRCASPSRPRSSSSSGYCTSVRIPPRGLMNCSDPWRRPCPRATRLTESRMFYRTGSRRPPRTLSPPAPAPRRRAPPRPGHAGRPAHRHPAPPPPAQTAVTTLSPPPPHPSLPPDSPPRARTIASVVCPPPPPDAPPRPPRPVQCCPAAPPPVPARYQPPIGARRGKAPRLDRPRSNPRPPARLHDGPRTVPAAARGAPPMAGRRPACLAAAAGPVGYPAPGSIRRSDRGPRRNSAQADGDWHGPARARRHAAAAVAQSGPRPAPAPFRPVTPHSHPVVFGPARPVVGSPRQGRAGGAASFATARRSAMRVGAGDACAVHSSRRFCPPTLFRLGPRISLAVVVLASYPGSRTNDPSAPCPRAAWARVRVRARETGTCLPVLLGICPLGEIVTPAVRGAPGDPRDPGSDCGPVWPFGLP